MKKKIYGFVLLGAFTMFALSAVTSCKKYDDDIDDLKKADATITAALADLTVDVEEELESLNAQLATVKTDLEGKIKAANDAAADAKAAAVAEVERAVAVEAALEARIAALEDAVKSIQDKDIPAVYAKINSVNEEIAGKLKNLSDKLDADEQAILNLQEQFNLQKQALEMYNENLTALASKVSGIGDDVTKLKQQVESLIGDIAEIQKMATKKELEDAKKELNVKINNLTTAINTLEGYLKGLITGVIFQAKEGQIYYGCTTSNVVFPFAGADSVINIPQNTYLIGNSSMKIYATVNPSNVDFSNTTLSLINSLNEVHPSFKLSALAQSNKKLTRATLANAGNGFYEMNVEPVSPESTVKPVSDATLYAMAADYVGANGNQRVTSKYEIELSAKVATPVTTFDWAGYYDAAGTKVAEPNPGFSDFEFLYDADAKTFESFLKVTNIAKSTVYKFYIDFDASMFDESPEKVVYDGSKIEDAFKFVCKTENVNKKIPVKFYILNYDGSIAFVKKTISYNRALIAPITLNLDVCPGAISDMDQGFAKVTATQALKDSLGENLQIYKDNAKVFTQVSDSVGAGQYIFSNFQYDANGLMTAIYDPMTIKYDKDYAKTPENKFKVTVKDDNNHLVTTVTVVVKVKTPNHLDAFIGANRISATFDVFNNGHANRTICWASNNSGKMSYDLSGSFGFLNGNDVTDASQACTDCGWKLSNNSKYQFRCTSDEIKPALEFNPVVAHPFNVTMNAKYLSVFSFKKDDAKCMYVENFENYKDSTFIIPMVEEINYYNSNKYYSNKQDAFELGFYDVVNYGIYKKAEAGKIDQEINIGTELPAYNVSVSFNNFKFDDYSYSPVKKGAITLYDERIKNVEIVKFEDATNNWRLIENWNFTWDKGTQTSKATFDYKSKALTKPVELNALLKITDEFGVVNVLKFTMTLKGPSGAKGQ